MISVSPMENMMWRLPRLITAASSPSEATRSASARAAPGATKEVVSSFFSSRVSRRWARR